MKWLEFASRFARRGTDSMQRQSVVATLADSSGSIVEELHGYTHREVDRALTGRVRCPDPAREIRYVRQPAKSVSASAGMASAAQDGATILQFRKAPVRAARVAVDTVSAA